MLVKRPCHGRNHRTANYNILVPRNGGSSSFSNIHVMSFSNSVVGGGGCVIFSIVDDEDIIWIYSNLHTKSQYIPMISHLIIIWSCSITIWSPWITTKPTVSGPWIMHPPAPERPQVKGADPNYIHVRAMEHVMAQSVEMLDRNVRITLCKITLGW